MRGRAIDLLSSTATHYYEGANRTSDVRAACRGMSASTTNVHTGRWPGCEVDRFWNEVRELHSFQISRRAGDLGGIGVLFMDEAKAVRQ